jgi:hypothetical protein
MENRRKEISPVDLYKATPRTNCRQCGFPSCLAFSVNVIVDRGDLALCPHISEAVRSQLGERISEQQARGIYLRREKSDIADDIARDLANLDFPAAALGMGARLVINEGEESIQIPLLDRSYTVDRRGQVSVAGEAPSAYERILLYNYMLRRGGPPPTGPWVTVESLPGALTKGPELEEACEAKISSACARFGDEALAKASLATGGIPEDDKGNADRAFRFDGFPRVPLLLLFWQGDVDFPSRVKLLMDETVGQHLDADSLIVLAGLLADMIVRKMESNKGA